MDGIKAACWPDISLFRDGKSYGIPLDPVVQLDDLFTYVCLSLRSGISA